VFSHSEHRPCERRVAECPAGATRGKVSRLVSGMPRRPLVRPKPGDADPALYRAADPGYPSNFSRDSLTYALLADDFRALRCQLEFSSSHQGRRRDPETGEEPGKIHHELPGVHMRELLTTYNACDTTSLFLIGIHRLASLGDGDVGRRYRGNLDRALEYVHEHLYDDVFTEDPAQCGAERFALKVTYWKDSELNVSGERREPTYPIAYVLAHFQAKEALQAAADITGSTELTTRAAAMTEKGFETFWRGDHFAVAVQRDGLVIDPPSSDSLHSLLFLHPDEIEASDAEAVVEYSDQLATSFGYLPGRAVAQSDDEYHTRWVWVHEQALLHAAARRHGLERAEQIAERIVPAFTHGFPELLDPATSEPGGNPTQLWAAGAHVYFEHARVERALARLQDVSVR
jgi:glycogen debranching enzyme